MLGRRFVVSRSTRLALVFALAAVSLSMVARSPHYLTRTRTVSQAEAGTLGSDAQSLAAGPGGAAGASQAAGARGASAAGLACAAGRNGGATDVGVTATSIKLGATVVRSGIGSAFLGGAPTAMQAVVDSVNRQGGVCGRLLDLQMVDDGWNASQGLTYLRSLIAKNTFALAVSPSSQGVDALIRAGDLRTGKIPLIGADGMVKSQYSDPWVWPVASSTVSTMHIMAQEAYARGARTFGIVFESDYKFGVEGAHAFNEAVKRLTGHDIAGFDGSLSRCGGTFCAVQSGQPSYSSEVQSFNSSCGKTNSSSGFHPEPNPPGGAYPSCDYVVLLLEPKTALTWLTKNGGIAPLQRTMGPEPLFNADFARQCDAVCNGMEVWTSFNPPIAPYDTIPAVTRYSGTVKAGDPSLDTSNSFTEGAYVGMEVLVEALRRLGPNVTRAGLQATLDSGTYDLSGLSPSVTWRPGNHGGNGQMQSYVLEYERNTFIDFKAKSPFVTDKFLGRDL
ncbi:MAG: hypothetical protein QOG03_1482 [Actinomycetota bacterium]|jgi:ABC-type branched-subunit amino acid transport system substrate-binding protein|nr:hypothetical protein [Actinomycetota bacterium]